MSTLHPHSTTHSATTGASLPALQQRAGTSGGPSGGTLCFDPRELSAAAGPFDPHAFVTQCLQRANPSFHASPDDADALVSSQAAALLRQHDSAADPGNDLVMPAQSASPSVPLELLREHLTRYQLYVKGELVELLNAEYARFIGLSSSLSGLDALIGAMQTQLSQLTTEVDSLAKRLHADALAPFQQKLLQQYMLEQHKQTFLHMVNYVLTHTRNMGAAVLENEQQQSREADAAEAQGQADAVTTTDEENVPPAQRRVIALHVSASRSRHQQRCAELKQQRRIDVARGVSRQQQASNKARSHAHPSYADLKLDLPEWMLQQYADATGAAVDEDVDSAEDDDDDEEREAELEIDNGACTNDAFGLYEALLHLPPETNSNSTSDSAADLSSLRTRLERVERASASFSGVRALLPLCAHFHVVRDLRHADGASGPFDQVAMKLHAQAKGLFRELLSIVGQHYERHAAKQEAEDGNSAAEEEHDVPFPPELLSLLRSALRSLSFLDLRSETEDLVRVALVQPMLQRRVAIALPLLRAAHALDENQFWTSYADEQSAAGDALSAAHPLRALYAHLLHFMRGPIQLLLHACARDEEAGALTPASLTGKVAGPPSPPAATDTGSSLPSTPLLLPFSFLSSFVSECLSVLSTEIGGGVLFSAGLPHVFHAHFQTTKTFLAQVEAFARRTDALSSHDVAESAAPSLAVAALHAHPSWLAFDKRWNTGIYFQLRFQAIATALEGAAVAACAERGGEMVRAYVRSKSQNVSLPAPADGNSSPSLSSLHAKAPAFRLSISGALWTALLACFSPRTFLSEVAHRFLKLALQCLARYARLVEELSAHCADGGAAFAAMQSNAAAPQGPEALLLLLAADLHTLLQLVPEQYMPFVARALGVRQSAATSARVQSALAELSSPAAASADSAANDAADDAALLHLLASSFSPSLARLRTLLASAHTQLSSLLLSRCTPALSYVSRIKPAYRFSRQPTHALQYVRAMMQPLLRVAGASDSGDVHVLMGESQEGVATGADDSSSAASGGEMDVNEGMADDVHDADPLPAPASRLSGSPAAAALLSPAARASVLGGVVRQLSALYGAEASKCLSGDIFGELSKKLNKRTPAGATAASAGGGSEVDKTRRQLHLDARLYARIVREQLALQDSHALLQPLLAATQLSA